VTPSPKIEAEEYAVYSALIDINPTNFNLGSTIVIRDQTISDVDQLDWTLERVDPVPSDVVDSYRSRNLEPYTLSPSLELEQDYALIAEEEVQEIYRQGWEKWVEFEDRYPESGGIVMFSRVGFNDNEDQAMVSMGVRCGELCGAGGLYILVKEEGVWKFERATMEWIS
jgi:hypothetical protein